MHYHKGKIRVLKKFKMDTNDYLKLTWSVHMNNFKDVIKDLQETEYLSDVTRNPYYVNKYSKCYFVQ